MMELRLLGTVDLRRYDGGSVRSVVVQPKRMALLAYLASATPRGPHRRDILLGLLWPELDADRGRGALSKALHHLRGSLGAEALVNRGEEAVELDGARVWSDVARFEEAVAAGDLPGALDLYGGDLLHGFFLSDAPEFERWLDGERTRLREKAAGAAGALADRARGAGDLASAVGWARRALALSGTREPEVRRLMALLDAAGDRAGALQTYEDFVARLRADLEVDPSPETRAVAEAVREREEVREAVRVPGGVDPDPVRDSAPAIDPSPDQNPAPALDRPGDRPPHHGLPSPPAPLRKGRLAAVAGLALAALAILAAVTLSPARALPGLGDVPLEPGRVLVLPFQNQTLDPALDPVGRMAADWITDGVSRTGTLEVVPSSAAWGLERAGGDTAGEPGPDGGTRRLARETGAGIVVSGSYYLDGDRLYLQAVTLDGGSGRVLRSVEALSVPRDSTVQGIDRLRSRVLAALVLEADTVYHIRAATPPPTYEAYRSYIQGMEAFVAGGDPATALRLYRQAAGEDSLWAMPRIAAAIMYSNLGNDVAADSILAPLAATREGLGPLERGTLDMVLGMLRGDYGAAYVGMREAARIAPGTINEYMVAELARMMNRPSEAVAVLEAMGPERGELRGWVAYWRELTWVHHMLGDHEASLSAARSARTLYPQEPTVLALEVRALAALGRVAEVRARVDERVASADIRAPQAGELMMMAARELEVHGHPGAAADVRERGLAWFQTRRDEVQGTPEHRSLHAQLLLDAGRLEEARDRLAVLVGEFPGNPILSARLGVVMARLGEVEGARAISREVARYVSPMGRAGPLNATRGEHTLQRAIISAWLADPVEAMELLRQAQGEGLVFGPDLHTLPALAPLRGDPGFQEWLRPR
jgi:DNA-binding SARP family transcriptional activator/TolB-like protein